MRVELEEKKEFHRVTSMAEAADLLRDQDAVLISGGQSLMPLLRQDLIDRDVIVDISGIDGYDSITTDEDGLHIGSLTTHANIAASDLENTDWIVLKETANEIGDKQIRNWGTVGGGVAHADPSLDYPPTMMVLDAEIEFTDGTTTDKVPINEFYLGPYMTVLAEDQIVTEIHIPHQPPNSGAAFEKFSWRQGDMSLVNAATWLVIEDDEVIDARISIGALASTPFRLTEIEEEITGRPTTEVLNTAELVPEYTDPVPEAHASIDFKNRVATNLTRRALERAIERGTT